MKSMYKPGDIVQDVIDGRLYFLVQFYEAPETRYNYWKIFDMQESFIYFLEEMILLKDTVRVS